MSNVKGLDITLQAMLTLNVSMGSFVEILIHQRQTRHLFIWVQIHCTAVSKFGKKSIKGGSFSSLNINSTESAYRKSTNWRSSFHSKAGTSIIFRVRSTSGFQALPLVQRHTILIPMVHLVQKVDSKYKKKLP